MMPAKLLDLSTIFYISYLESGKMYSTQWGSDIKELKWCLNTLQILWFYNLVVVFHDCLMDMSFICIQMCHPTNIYDNFVTEDESGTFRFNTSWQIFNMASKHFSHPISPTHGKWWSVWCDFMAHKSLRWFLGHLQQSVWIKTNL